MAFSNPLIPRVNIINATPDTQLVTLGTFIGSVTGVTNIAGVYATGCILQALDGVGLAYKNAGTTASPNFIIIDTSTGGLPAITDGQIFYANASGIPTAGFQFGKSDKTSLNKVLGSTKFDDRPTGGSMHDYNVQLRAVVGKTSGAYIGLDGETHLGATGTTSIRGTQGVAVVDATFTATGSTMMGLYGQARVDGTMAGSSFLIGVYGLIEASTAITASHVAAGWFDTHQVNAITGEYELVYMSNNGTLALDQFIYAYGSSNALLAIEYASLPAYITAGTAADGTPIKLKILVHGTAYYLNAYPTNHP